MAIFELYHQRKKKSERAGEPEVYVYDQIPGPLRIQIAQIAKATLGFYWSGSMTYAPANNNNTWRELHEILLKELGRDTLTRNKHPDDDVISFLRVHQDVDECLSVIELLCFVIDKVMGGVEPAEVGATQRRDEALDEINYRLRQASVGYQYENGHLIRVDSHVMHEEVVKPALRLLSDKRFAGAEQEYLTAHKHFRDGNAKDAVTWANNAFESTMKAACDIKGWPYGKGARASDLAKILQSNGLWPDYLDTSFEQLIATLKSGLPKVRNDAGAHGQGAEPKETPMYVAAYALHLAAAKIVLIGEAALGNK